MAPPGIDMGSNDGSLDLSDSPDKADRKRRAVAGERGRSPRRAASSAGRRSNRSDSGSRRPPASRTSSVRLGGLTPRASTPRTPRSASRGLGQKTPCPDEVQAFHRRVVMDSSEPFGPNFAKAVALQMEADREHM